MSVEDDLRSNHRLIRATSKKLRKAVSVGQKRHLETILQNLHAEKLKLKQLITVSGGGGGNVRNRRVRWHDVLSAFNGRVRTGAIVNLTHTKLDEFFSDCTKVALKYLKKTVRKYSCIKVNFVFSAIFVKPNNPDIEDMKYFSTRNYELLQSTNIKDVFDQALDKINSQLVDFSERESGSALKTIINLVVNMSTSGALRHV